MTHLTTRATLLSILILAGVVLPLLSGCGAAHVGSLATGNTVRNGAEPPADSRMIGSDRRKAVVYECWYALRESYLKTPDDSGPTGGTIIGSSSCISNWSYLGSDTNAFTKVKDIVGTDNASVATDPKFSTDAGYTRKSGYGRGGQCTYFGCLILFRALNGLSFSTDTSHAKFRWSDLDTAKYKYSAVDAQPGDLVFTKKDNQQHLAVCVRNLGNNKIEVVESNSAGTSKTDKTYAVGKYGDYWNSEIIGRRTIDAKAGDYRLITGDAKKHTELKHRRWYNL